MDEIKVNDCVRIDGGLRGRVMNILQPLGTFNVYDVKLEDGSKKQVARYRLQKLSETVSTGPSESFFDDDLMNSLFDNDIFSEEVQYCYTSEIEEFIQGNMNLNTARKTSYDLKVLYRFMNEQGDSRKIEDISPEDLCKLLCKFVMVVKKGDESNYEPNSLRSILSSIDRHLGTKSYGKSILFDFEFNSLKDVLKAKHKLLKQDWLGNLPKRAQSLSDIDIETLWNSGELGVNNPESILNTLWWHNTTHFGLRSVTPHRNMNWGDVNLKTDDNGVEFLEFTERQTKTRTGVKNRDVCIVTPKAWATGDDRCPVLAYKTYGSLRPLGFSTSDAPFYLATNSKSAPVGDKPWFKRQPVGVNKLASIMKRMASNANLEPSKRLIKHSARKYLVQTLSEKNVPPTQIMQISGHKNVPSINNYSHISEDQHKSISKMLSRPSDVASNSHMALVAQENSHSSVANVASQNQLQTINVTDSSSPSLSSIFAGAVNNSVIHVNLYGGQSNK